MRHPCRGCRALWRTTLSRLEMGCGPLQPALLGVGFAQKLIPVAGWMSALQHLPENPVGVIAALVGPFRILVVDPSEYDDLAGHMKAKEQPVLLEELGAKPVLVFFAERIALSVLVPRWILGNRIERQVRDGCKPFRRVFFCEARRVLLLESFNLPDQ